MQITINIPVLHMLRTNTSTCTVVELSTLVHTKYKRVILCSLYLAKHEKKSYKNGLHTYYTRVLHILETCYKHIVNITFYSLELYPLQTDCVVYESLYVPL